MAKKGRFDDLIFNALDPGELVLDTSQGSASRNATAMNTRVKPIYFCTGEFGFDEMYDRDAGVPLEDQMCFTVYEVKCLADVNEISRRFGLDIRVALTPGVCPFWFYEDAESIRRVMRLSLQILEVLANGISGVIACIKDDFDGVPDLDRYFRTMKSKRTKKKSKP